MSILVSDGKQQNVTYWKESMALWISFFFFSAFLVFALYEDGLNRMVNNWFTREEYSHGVMIPFITAFLIWQRKDVLGKMEFGGSWGGVSVVLLGVLFCIIGELSAITVFFQYGFVIVLAGIILSYMGWRAFKYVAVPVLLLALMVPLPGLVFQELSQKLQLISSTLGVSVIRLFDISVHLEGNVIDLGSLKLQVVEACSGLRYLFPLMTLGVIAAYFYKAAMWKKWSIFLSSIPVTVLMNSFRIGAIGVTVEYWGPSMAEGFLHDFEGWIVFMACTAILVAEMWLLTMLGKERKPLREVFGLEFPAPVPSGVMLNTRPVPTAYWIAGGLVVIVSLIALFAPSRVDPRFDRKEFAVFPTNLGEWAGKTDKLEQIYVDALKMDDYFLGNYQNPEGKIASLYMVYYLSQSKGESIHSPKACLPGGGWKIKDFREVRLDSVTFHGAPLAVNRVEIQEGENRQLVYYWFLLHGRNVTDEYLLKWFVFLDGVTKNRTDGALIRLTVPMPPSENYDQADKRLTAFTGLLMKQLNGFIPE